VVERWRRSGLAAGEFAGREGVNVQTLYSWKYRLGREQRDRTAIADTRALPASVELRSSAGVGDSRFEIGLGGGRTLRVPAAFDAAALRRLLAVLDGSAA
jgi:transposase-like protein